jgi:hypothetical protein
MLELRIVQVMANNIPGFAGRNFVVTDRDGEIMYAYPTRKEAQTVVDRVAQWI